MIVEILIYRSVIPGVILRPGFAFCEANMIVATTGGLITLLVLVCLWSKLII